jgi:hypothetical protein
VSIRGRDGENPVSLRKREPDGNSSSGEEI